MSEMRDASNAKRRYLSGCVRLWIVGAALIWAGGLWYTVSHPIPPARSAYPDYTECTPLVLRACDGRGAPETPVLGAPTITCEEAQNQQARCLDRQAADVRQNRASYAARQAEYDRAHLLQLCAYWAIIVFAPFALGVVVWLLRGVVLWVRRGFRTKSI